MFMSTRLLLPSSLERIFSRIFGIMGIKNSEMEDEFHKWKARVVLGGNNIKLADQTYAIFAESSAIPATMQATRCAIAVYSMRSTILELLQSDCIRAYVQTKLVGPKTFIRLPKAWWPKKWLDKGMVDPVCELLLALYGHPRAGDMWHDKIRAVLIRNGFAPEQGWPSVYCRSLKVDNVDCCLCFVLYVDDLVMLGPKKALADLLVPIRKEILMEEPTPLDRYLGCHHKFTVNGKSVKTVIDMTKYFESKVKIFEEERPVDLKKVESPYVDKLRQVQQDLALITPGVYADTCSSPLMALL